MNSYILNEVPEVNGEHKIHTMECSFLPTFEYRIPLGVFEGCEEAFKEAKKTVSSVTCCEYCCFETRKPGGKTPCCS